MGHKGAGHRLISSFNTSLLVWKNLTLLDIDGQKYGSVAAALHWIMAALVIALIALGKLVDVFPKSYEPFIVETHKAVGVIVLLLALFRLTWRLTHRVPPLPSGTPFWQVFAAHGAHWTFYALMLILPVSGIAWQFLRGRGNDFWLFAINSPFVDDRAAAKLYSQTHRLLGDVILILVIVHIAAALYHQFFRRDGLIFRMLPRRGA